MRYIGWFPARFPPSTVSQTGSHAGSSALAVVGGKLPSQVLSLPYSSGLKGLRLKGFGLRGSGFKGLGFKGFGVKDPISSKTC